MSNIDRERERRKALRRRSHIAPSAFRKGFNFAGSSKTRQWSDAKICWASSDASLIARKEIVVATLSGKNMGHCAFPLPGKKTQILL